MKEWSDCKDLASLGFRSLDVGSYENNGFAFKLF